MRRSKLFSSIAICSLLAVAAAPLPAQVADIANSGPRFLWAPAGGATAADASNAELLHRRVSLNLYSGTLDAALKEIARQGRLELMYSEALVPADRRVTLQAQDITVAAALTEVLLDTGVDVVVLHTGQVGLVRKQAAPGVVTGTVTDAETGSPIANANVRVEGTRFGTITDADGRFRIADVPPGRYRVTASLIGYAPITHEVDVGDGATVALEFALEISPSPLDQIVVTGTVVPTSRRELPNPITTITADEIQRQRPASIAELLRGQVPGVVSPDNGQAAEALGAGRGVYVRGGTTLGGAGSNTMKIYLDGIELSDPRQINSIDPSMIDRIEILRGPQASTIYGSGALGGVMQIFTKKGTWEQPLNAEVDVSVGMIETNWTSDMTPSYDHEASVNGGVGLFSYNFGGSYLYTGDWTPDWYLENKGLNGAVRMRTGPLTASLTSRLNDRKSRAGINPFVREQITTGQYSYTPAGVAPFNNHYSTNQQTLGLAVNYTPTSWWSHNLTVGADWNDIEGGRAEPTYTSLADTITTEFVNNNKRRTYAYNTSVAIALGQGLNATVTAGLDQWRYDRKILSVSPFVTSGDTIAEENRGYFGQVQMGLRDRLFLTLGLRAEDNDNFGDDVGLETAPRFGAAYIHSLDDLILKLRGSYGTATRPPQNNQQNAYTINAFQEHIANPDLGPEYQEGGDIGFETYHPSIGSLEVTYYDQTVYDLIYEVYEQTTTPEGGSLRLRQHQNLGDVKNRGWEFQGRAFFGPVQFEGTFSIIDSHLLRINEGYRGELEPGDRLEGIARKTGSATIAHVTPGTYVGVTMTHVGTSRQLDNRAYELARRDRLNTDPVSRFDYVVDDYPAVTRFHVTATRDMGSRITGYLRVDNALDDYANDVDSDDPTRGRLTTLGARVRVF